jgi:hypothetical protein
VTQLWPGEVLEERAGELAVAFAVLLTRQAAWRHRRVETITVLSHEAVRRAVSVDFTLPEEHRGDLAVGGEQVVVPLALVAKRALVHFDLRDDEGRSVPLLRAEEIQTISRELLYLAADVDLVDADDPTALLPLVDAVVERALETEAPDAARMRAIEDDLATLEARAGPVPGFAGLADQLARGFLLCALLPDAAGRHVVKFAYDEPLERPSRHTHFYDAPGCTQAASYHVEVAVPDELRARTTALVDDATGDELARGPRDADRPALHYAVPSPPPALGRPGVSVAYGTERARFLVPAAIVATVTTLQLGLPWLFADLDRLATQAGPAITILLSTTAIFSGLVLRSGEHPLVRLILVPYRGWLVLSTLAAVAAAASLGFQARPGVLGWVWGLGALAAASAAGILTIEALRAPMARRTPRS